MKKGIRYIRISKEKQSNFSIDAQQLYTMQWFERNEVELVDTFIDDGYSAQTFDRPDFTALEKYIAQYHRTVDYLVVNTFDRFSRDAGEALMKIKSLQNKFAISVVSVVEGVTFDKNDPGSFFYTGLLLLKGEDELIRHKNRVNLGIYTGKKKFGRYMGKAPFGYKNAKDDTCRPILVIDEVNADVVRFVFRAFLMGTPDYIIREDILRMSSTAPKSPSVVQRILSNPAYAGLLMVKEWKDLPGGMVEAQHTPIIDKATWAAASEKMKGGAVKTILDESLPLRGVLKCHYGKMLTGAPSTGKMGKKFWYYKCPTASAHNNISAIKSTKQLEEALALMSPPKRMVDAISQRAQEILSSRMGENKKLLEVKRREIQDTEKKILNLEERYLADLIGFETYNRWHTTLTQKKIDLKVQAEKLGQDQTQAFAMLATQLARITDLRFLWQKATIPQKQALIRMVFDSKLYYKGGVYRTPYIMPIFAHNWLEMKEKNLLICEADFKKWQVFPSGGGDGIEIEHLTNLLKFVSGIRAA